MLTHHRPYFLKLLARLLLAGSLVAACLLDNLFAPIIFGGWVALELCAHFLRSHL